MHLKTKPVINRGGAGRGQGRRALYDAPLDAQIQARVTAGQRAAYERLGGADWLRAQLDEAAQITPT